jgi:hypothetical protein
MVVEKRGFSGRVDGDAQICDLVLIGEGAFVGGLTIVCGDDIVRGDVTKSLERPTVTIPPCAAIRCVGQTL